MNNDILIITTGGTFDSVFSPQKYKPTPAPHTLIKDFFDKYIRPQTNYEFLEFSQIDSVDMTEALREDLAKTILKTNFDRILVIHGTDTIIETGKILNDRIDNKTVILTGAFIPFSFHPSDGGFNLGYALNAAQNLDNGVYIAMNAKIYKPEYSYKDFENLVFVETDK